MIGFRSNRPHPPHSRGHPDFAAWRLIRDAFAVRKGGLRLRLAIELPLKAADLIRSCKAHRNSPRPSPSAASTSEVRGLCSAGVTQPRRSLRPCPTPALRPPPQRWRRGPQPRQGGSPPITRIALPTCRAHYPGGSRWGFVDGFPISRGFPRFLGGSASALSLSRPAQPPDQVPQALT